MFVQWHTCSCILIARFGISEVARKFSKMASSVQALLWAAALLPSAYGQTGTAWVSDYGWKFADEENTLSDPWTPCERKIEGRMTRGFCRLSCTAKWSFAPARMDWCARPIFVLA